MNEWISVKEKLPEKDIEVLIVVITNDEPFIEHARLIEKGSQIPQILWQCVSCCDYPYYGLEDISHWMPLPEPPKL